MIKQLVAYIILLSAITAQGQYLSVKGDFSIDQRRGCRDLLVTVTNINPGDGVILYQYEGRSSPVTANSNFSYASTGTFWLYQYIQGGTLQKVDSIFVEILDPNVPNYQLNSCNGLQVEVQLLDNSYDIYEIDYGDGTILQAPVNSFPPTHNYASTSAVNVSVTGLYSTANNRCASKVINFIPVNQIAQGRIDTVSQIDDKTLIINYTLAPNTESSLEISVGNNSAYQLFKKLAQGTTSDTIRNLSFASNPYCFRIASHDACSNLKDYSNEVCSVYLKLKAVNNQMDLSWITTYPSNFSQTNILRDNLTINTLTTNTLTFSDTTAQCNLNYCYTVQVSHTNGAISRSNGICDLAFSTDIPSSVVNVSTSTEDNLIRWNWQTPANENVQFYQIFNNAGVLLDTTLQNTYAENLIADTQQCIKIKLTNSCQNISGLSQTFCPFTATSTFNADGSVSLTWPPYDGWQNGVASYSVSIFDVNMNFLDSVNVGTMTTFTDPLPPDNNQVSYYKVQAFATDPGLSVTKANLIRVERPPVIAIPSSFTPNGDNLNDVFLVSGKFISAVEINIINRWGSIIYKVNGVSWDGRVNGEKAPLGTYVYHIIIKDFAGNEHIRNGSVLILKN